VREIIAAIGIQEREVSAAALNGILCSLDDIVSEGASLLLVTPMGGG